MLVVMLVGLAASEVLTYAPNEVVVSSGLRLRAADGWAQQAASMPPIRMKPLRELDLPSLRHEE